MKSFGLYVCVCLAVDWFLNCLLCVLKYVRSNLSGAICFRFLIQIKLITSGYVHLGFPSSLTRDHNVFESISGYIWKMKIKMLLFVNI